MRLQDLPPELMRAVLDRAGSSSVINLWLSGAPRLLQLLGDRRSVVSIELRDTSKRSTSQWPKFLSSLKGLTDLRVKRPYTVLGFPRLVHEELIHMPQLKSLHLECLDSGNVLVGGHLRRFLPNLETLSVSVLQTALNATDLPQSITSLHIEIANAPINFTALDAKLELPNLTKFTCAYSRVCQVPLGNFPIEELKAPIHLLSDNGLLLPTHLTHLTLTGQLTDLAFLPSNLRYLNVNTVGSALMNRPFRKMTLLETLVYTHAEDFEITFPSDPQPMFPTSLRHLTVGATRDDIGDFVLPPFLESLDMTISRNPPSSFLTEIVSPSHLKSSHSSYNISAHGETVSVEPGLPGSLLRFTAHCRVSGSVWNIFSGGKVPQNLQLFKLSCVDWLEDKTDILPPSITHLSLPRLCHTHLSTFDRLVHLELQDTGDWPIEHFYQLPQTLQTLDLRLATGLDETLLEHLPQSLITLNLMPDHQERPELTEKGMRSLSRLYNLKQLSLGFGCALIQDWMLRSLPRSLRSLHLRTEGSKISSLCFASLPRLLQHLTLTHLHYVQPNHILALPQNLRSLEITSVNSPKVLPEYCPPLPATLDQLTSVLKFPAPKAHSSAAESPTSQTKSIGFNFHSPCDEEFRSALVPLCERHSRPSLPLTSVLGVLLQKSLIWMKTLSYFHLCVIL